MAGTKKARRRAVNTQQSAISQKRAAVSKWQLAVGKTKPHTGTLSTQQSAISQGVEPKAKAGLKNRKPRPKKLALKELAYPDQRVVQFPQVQGKTAEKIEVLTSPGFHAITLAFRDKSALTLAIEPGFTLKAAYEYRRRGKSYTRLWPEIGSHKSSN